MFINPVNFTINDYLGQTFECECGHTHQSKLREVMIEAGAIKHIPQLLEKFACGHPMIICDRSTVAAAGQLVNDTLCNAGISPLLHVIDRSEVVPNEDLLGELMMAHTPDIDLLIAVGTGTINDTCKFLSYHLGLPYIVVATAPSMDGFASIGAALITDNLKTTYDTHVPIAIVGDVDVLKKAPMPLITAGLGDILGKYTCLTDWKLAHIVNDEYYCPVIVKMVQQSIAEVTANAQKVLQRDEAAIAAIMKALVLTGIAMSFVGNSRPASGSEHHISHYWEMRFLFDGRKPVLHGAKVGIGTVISCYLYNHLKEMHPDFSHARQQLLAFDHAKWEQEMHRTFLQAANAVIALEEATQKNGAEGCSKRIGVIEAKWPEIVEMINESVPPTQKIIELLSSLGAPVYPSQKQVDRQLVLDGIMVAKEVRDRYTILQLLWDLGLIEQEAQTVVEWLDQQ